MIDPIIMPVIILQVLNNNAEEMRRTATLLNANRHLPSHRAKQTVDCYYCKNSEYTGFLCQDCGRTIE